MPNTTTDLIGTFRPHKCFTKADGWGSLADGFYNLIHANYCSERLNSTDTYEISYSEPILVSYVDLELSDAHIIKEFDKIQISTKTIGEYSIQLDWVVERDDEGNITYDGPVYETTYDTTTSIVFYNSKTGETLNGPSVDFVARTWDGNQEPLWSSMECLSDWGDFNRTKEDLLIQTQGGTYTGRGNIMVDMFEKTNECLHLDKQIVSINDDYHKYVCNECRSEVQESHLYVDGVCTVCNYSTNTNSLAFTSNGDGTCYVSGIGTCTDTDIIIPSNSPAGDLVTGIGDEAFPSNTQLESVIIPDSVLTIGNYAFVESWNLSHVEISGNSKLTTISGGAFFACTDLEFIRIPVGVTKIGSGAFEDCTSLTSIVVDDNNKNYKSIDGNLYTKDKTSLIQYATGKTESTFIIPEGVVTIEDAAFKNSSIRTVTIPVSVKNIEAYAFNSCSKLETINYHGTEEQWNAIEKGGQWDDYAGAQTELGTYKLVFLSEPDQPVEPEEPVNPVTEPILAEKLFSNINEGLTLETKNTIAYKNTAVHLNYLDIVKLNNPSNIKSGKTLFGITGTNTGSAPNKQAAVVIHDGNNTNIYPFYGNESYLQNITWAVESDKITFSDGQAHKFVSDKGALGISTQVSYIIDDNGLAVGDLGGTLVPDQIVEYWVVYRPVTTTVHFLWNDGTSIGTATTTAAEPYLFGGGGHGDGLGIYLGAKVFADESTGYPDEPPYEDYFYISALYSFRGFSFERNGEYFAGKNSWYPLAAGETYTVYVRHWDDFEYSDTPTTLTVDYRTQGSHDSWSSYQYQTATTYVLNPEISIENDDDVKGDYGIKFGDQVLELYNDAGANQIAGFTTDDFYASTTIADLQTSLTATSGEDIHLTVISYNQLNHNHSFPMFDETTYDPCICGCVEGEPTYVPPESCDHEYECIESGVKDDGQPYSVYQCIICGNTFTSEV